jgi:uncharacterized protein
MAAKIVHLKPTRPCPICGKSSVQAYHPFCSGRCQDVDLHRWLSGTYRIPTNEEPVSSTQTEEPED